MRFSHAKAGLGIAALAALLAFGSTANAAPVSKCNAAKKKCIGKYIAAQMGCHAKAESKGLAVDPACLAKGTAKITTVENKGCFDKNNLKIGNDCSSTSPAGTTAELSAADAFITDVVNDIDPAYPAASAISKCSAAEKKCVGKKAAGMLGCEAKENKAGVVEADVQACRDKITDKFGGVKGCYTNAQLKGVDCLVAQPNPTTASIETKVDTWRDGVVARLDPSNCGNGVIDPGEFCDPPAVGACGADFACVSCNCACPTNVVFSGNATAPESILDTGWTGISHRAPIITNGDVTVNLSCAATQRPCGVCAVTGPIANPNAGAGQLDNTRCSQDSSRKCTTDGQCTTRMCLGGPNNGAGCANDSVCPSGSCPAAGTCEVYFGSTLPLAAGGVTTCVSNQFNGNVTGTANVETGEAVNTALLSSRVFLGIAIDNPCPRCTDAGGINDGANGGTCDGGPRLGLACDANGFVPGRPDYGRTSLDCPPNPAAIIANLPIDLTNATDPVTRTLTAASPNCTASAGDKCLCNTCNNASASPCGANADCPDPAGPIGPICGGLRCLSGANNGQACTAASECPGGSCARPGEPTKPSGCLDDTTVADRDLECSDTFNLDPADGEGLCTIGPIDQTCSVASGHAQRGCTNEAQCGCVSGCCISQNRRCFLTGGGTFQVSGTSDGTDTLIAVGMEDLPMGDVSNPTLGAVFCVGPTGAAAVNNVAGLPGPARVTIKGTAVGHP